MLHKNKPPFGRYFCFRGHDPPDKDPLCQFMVRMYDNMHSGLICGCLHPTIKNIAKMPIETLLLL